ncbi:hypothetical protein K505DRAFT_371478 [Melanomma pulvis-pyrius CBS 109.77]|uniref:CCHC-type domain-containing protein n=1 Tax=Melanomma pulvis-pyrius CBS 109.77 TaxID=1314802 RepID=A0A6A6XRW6_9PLEO|nr:hypothetical protein K505DRAFT_371478 [Melanomma pulvis-pyrius CBS 109.77]
MPVAAHSENKMGGTTNKTSSPTRETRKDSATGAVRGKESQVASETSATIKKPPTSPYLSPGQLAKLKSGPKVHIFIGPADFQYVGVEGAYANLLAHFSNYAKAKLVNERAPGLSIIDGAKTAVVWIYKYMLAGGSDPDGLEKLDDLPIADLVVMYSHCVVLEYQQLMDRILALLHEKLYHSLPDVSTIKNIAIFAPSINKLAAKAVARILVQPLEFDYGPYMAHATNDDDFSTAIGLAVQDMLKRRIVTGVEYYNSDRPNRYVTWSTQYYRKRAQRTSPPPESKKTQPSTKDTQPVTPIAPTEGNKQKKSQKPKRATKSLAPSKVDETLKDDKSPHKPTTTLLDAGDSNSDPKAHVGDGTTIRPTQKYRKKPRCYTCKERGHTQHHCTNHISKDSVAQDTTTVPATPIKKTPDESTSKKLVDAIKEVTKKPVRPPPVCYACNDEGHIARNCPAPPAAYLQGAQTSNKNGVMEDITSQARTSAFHGRNKFYRRAKAERVHYDSIVVVGNGEGLRTCDREVRPGEYTRTGLPI